MPLASTLLCEARTFLKLSIIPNLRAGGLTEGATFDSPLFECDNFVITPHLGAQTVDASRDIAGLIISKVKEALDLK